MTKLPTSAKVTRHNDECVMAFGKLSPRTVCPRCDELRFGAPAKRGWTPRRELGYAW